MWRTLDRRSAPNMSDTPALMRAEPSMARTNARAYIATGPVIRICHSRCRSAWLEPDYVLLDEGAVMCAPKRLEVAHQVELSIMACAGHPCVVAQP
jgi:hypothetical protein